MAKIHGGTLHNHLEIEHTNIDVFSKEKEVLRMKWVMDKFVKSKKKGFINVS